MKRTFLTLTLMLIFLRVFGQEFKAYQNFDYVAGDSVLFEDELLDEQVNEIPSLWIPVSGRFEIVKSGDAYLLGFLDSNPYAYPRMKKYNYLPARFTVEFDFIAKHNSGKSTARSYSDGNGSAEIKMYFYSDTHDFNEEALGDFGKELLVRSDGSCEFGQFSGRYSTGENSEESPNIKADLCDKWIHVSLSVTEKGLKLYINSQRVLNVPVTKGKAASMSWMGNGTDYEMGFKTYMRNVRIAGGLSDPYKTLTSQVNARFIARGITFDVNKATLKPESMGEINRIMKLMKENAGLKFEIGGHTDAQGDDASNVKLSQTRAEAVKSKLKELGVDEGRLTAKGYGEAQPVGSNETPEGRANNRRVEFVKL